MNKNVIRIGASIAAMAGSAIFVAMYMANGISYGALVGLKGREHDLQIASVRSSRALAFALCLQVLAIVMTMLSLARRGSEVPGFSSERWITTLWHLVVSVVVSILGTALIFELILKIGKAIRF